MRKQGKAGFTMAELLIVVAIIAVLVAIAIPVFNSQLEKSREATDLANVRAAYAEVMNDVNTDASIQPGSTYSRTVPLEQKTDGWQTAGDITIGGITHKHGEGDTDHWKGTPVANGTCKVSYSAASGVVFEWGDGASTPGGGSTPTAADNFTQLKTSYLDSHLDQIRQYASENGGFHAFLIQDASGATSVVSSIEDPSIGTAGWPSDAVAAVFSSDGEEFGFYDENWSAQACWTVGGDLVFDQ